jgi:putative addiction module component (TIGR02574 family)
MGMSRGDRYTRNMPIFIRPSPRLSSIRMIQSTLLTDIRRLSVAERILLVEEIWNSIAADSESLPLTDAERAELDRRLDAYHQSPDEGSSWEDVKSRLQGLQ